MDYYALSLRTRPSLRYRMVAAFRADMPGYVCGLLAGPILLLLTCIAL
jgi:hypothetical protein